AIILSSFVFLQPKTEAIDPVTISLLAPYAMPVAEAAAQYAIKGMLNAAPGFIEIGKDIFSIFLLPLGVIEATLGAPFGFFYSGANHLISGIEAPFLLVFDTLILPIRFFGFKP
ncbi:MAG TPA: hypothetical protein P5239_02355, partial [Victivallales bacterium]|nr:hypothetical protein [Victivallales bacterium]